jgi:proline dehydrogenase
MSTDHAARSAHAQFQAFHLVRKLLIHLSASKRLAPLIMNSGISRRVAGRFVAGQKLEDGVEAARAVNRAGQSASLDLLGENVDDEPSAHRSAQDYLEIFDRIAQEQLDANVSLKLTQLGLDLGVSVCEELLDAIVSHAAHYANFVRVDMEGSPYTERILEMVKRVRARHDNVGTVVQAYLYRTEQDVRDLLAIGCRLRLCKGAYNEPAEIAFAKKSDVDANYVKLMKLLLPSGIYHGIATHDPAMIQATKDFARQNRIDHGHFEFQMLYGIRTDLQRQLVHEGYRLRIYIPYGTDWFPYFMRRLAERPANLAFFLRTLLPSRG